MEMLIKQTRIMQARVMVIDHLDNCLKLRIDIIAGVGGSREQEERVRERILSRCDIVSSSLRYPLPVLNPAPSQLSVDPLGSNVMVTKLLQEPSTY
jgi:hypothetical protein